MITAMILSFFGLSCLASLIVFAACAASARADQIQREAFPTFAHTAEFAAGQEAQAAVNPQLALASSSI